MAPNIRSLNMRKEEEHQMDDASVAEPMSQSIQLPVYKTQELITARGVFVEIICTVQMSVIIV